MWCCLTLSKCTDIGWLIGQPAVVGRRYQIYHYLRRLDADVVIAIRGVVVVCKSSCRCNKVYYTNKIGMQRFLDLKSNYFSLVSDSTCTKIINYLIKTTNV